MTGNGPLADFVKHGNELKQNQLTSKQEELYDTLSNFLADTDGLPVAQQVVVLDRLIAFTKNPTDTPNNSGSQLALGAGSSPLSSSSPEELVRALLANEEVPTPVHNLIERVLMTQPGDEEHIAIDQKGTPVKVKQLEKTVRDLTADKLGLEQDVKDLKEKPADANNAAPAATMPLNKAYTTAEQIRELLDKGKPSKALLSNKPIVTLQGDDYDKIGTALDLLRDPKKVNKDDDAPKAGH